jgi:hypothetical protein
MDLDASKKGASPPPGPTPQALGAPPGQRPPLPQGDEVGASAKVRWISRPIR